MIGDEALVSTPLPARVLAGHVLRRWPLVALLGIVGLAVGLAAAYLPEPTYRAEALLAPAQGEELEKGLGALGGGVGGLASLVCLMPWDGALQAETVLLMQSRSFAEAFIREHDLLPVLYAEYWDAEHRRWTGPLAEKPPTTQSAAAAFVENLLKLEQDAKTRTVRVSIEWRDPVVAARWVNDYVDRANELVRQRELAESTESLQYLRRELERTEILETRAALYRLTEAQLQRATLANVRREFVFRVLDPAQPPEPDDIYKPKRVLVVALGLVTGLLVGVFAALIWTPAPPRRAGD